MITLYSDDYGQTIKVNTYISDIGDATSITIKMKKLGSTTTATLSASEVAGDENYAVSADIASGWLSDKTGKWVAQVVAVWTDAEVTGKEFIIEVVDRSSE